MMRRKKICLKRLSESQPMTAVHSIGGSRKSLVKNVPPILCGMLAFGDKLVVLAP